MKKLNLDIDRLRVETFEAESADADGHGTVHGHWSQPGTCDGRVATCQYGGSCGAGCATRINCTQLDCI
jgi:hypothetical protein